MRSLELPLDEPLVRSDCEPDVEPDEEPDEPERDESLSLDDDDEPLRLSERELLDEPLIPLF